MNRHLNNECSGIGKIEDNLASADPLSYTTTIMILGRPGKLSERLLTCKNPLHSFLWSLVSGSLLKTTHPTIPCCRAPASKEAGVWPLPVISSAVVRLKVQGMCRVWNGRCWSIYDTKEEFQWSISISTVLKCRRVLHRDLKWKVNTL